MYVKINIYIEREPAKTNMTMETPSLEDVFPLEHGIVLLVFRGVHIFTECTLAVYFDCKPDLRRGVIPSLNHRRY